MTFSKNKIFVIVITLALAGLLWKTSGREPSLTEASSPREAEGSSSQKTSLGPTDGKSKVNSMSETTARQVQVLGEILASHNDNDPRMDSELKDLNSETKTVLQEKYSSLPETDRNGRGTIVFLIGRNLTTPADYQFLRQVLTEAPCLGLVDCAKPMQASAGEEEAGIGAVLDYPQLTALKAIEKHPAQSESLKGLQVEVLQVAKASRSAKVSESAEAIDRKLK